MIIEIAVIIYFVVFFTINYGLIIPFYYLRGDDRYLHLKALFFSLIYAPLGPVPPLIDIHHDLQSGNLKRWWYWSLRVTEGLKSKRQEIIYSMAFRNNEYIQYVMRWEDRDKMESYLKRTI